MHLNLPTFTAFSGFCALALGLFCSSYVFPKLEGYLISKAIALEEGGKAYEAWKNIPFPFKLKVYFFNVTNANDVQMGSKPILREIGPYIYDEFREREVLGINDENDSIRYTQKKNYYFNKDESGCRSEDDIITILHFAIVSMAFKINNISPMALPMLNDSLPLLFPNIKDVFITNSVRKILFDGLEIMCDSEEVDMICEGLRSTPPHTIRPTNDGKGFLLSLFHHMNNTNEGPFEIGRGLKDTVKGKVLSFKENNLLTQWKSSTCNEIRGTDLTINPNLPEVPQKINFFVPDFCRYFSAKFQEELHYFGLKTYIFKTVNLFQSRENCFCEIRSYEEDDDDRLLPNCPPKGTMEVSRCTGSPIVISQPHFLGAEKSLLEFSQGLKPNRDRHGTFIFMEPKTGLALKVKIRIQMNIFLKHYEDVSVLKNVSEGYFPFMWIENGAEVPMNIIEEVKNNFSKLKVFDFAKYVLITGGIIMLGVSIILAMVKDKVVCSCSKKSANSVKRRDYLGRFMNMYSDFEANNGVTLQQQHNVGRYVPNITE
ncbi:sensory neuron membrane protein 2-like [Zophobas morio]|uniref:sensory neuron membrane protein 2-like n=1 Tax=Zophobas morio TaxID=2755281 RepID=UPI003083284E